MNGRNSQQMLEKVCLGFKTKKDLKTGPFKGEKETVTIINNKDYGKFLITTDAAEQDIDKIIKAGFGKYGLHGGISDSILDVWFDTEFGKFSVIGIPQSELIVF